MNKEYKLPEIMAGLFTRPKIKTVSEWADNHRVLDAKTSAESGQWRTDRTPYLRGVMDAFTDPNVQDVAIMFSTQVGKTESLFNALGYAIDQDPAPAFFVLPTEDLAKDISNDRVKPMIDLSPALSRHKTGTGDDLTKRKMTFDRMILYFGWSNSAAGLASKPIRYLFMDEIDKYPKFSGREADPVKLATERTRTFWNRKIVKCSTPTTKEGYIYREYMASDQQKYFVPCPHCGEYQILDFQQIKWPKGENRPAEIISRRLAWYECVHCRKKIVDNDKVGMLERGEWVPEGCEIDKAGAITGEGRGGKRRGFWLNCLYSPWLTFSEIAAEFLSSKKVEELMNFVNSWLAEVWEEKAEETKENQILSTVAEYDEGILPDPVQVLTAGVDVQKGHFFFVIRGWGYQEENWLIRRGRLESWEEVEAEILLTSYRHASGGGNLMVRLACIDSGYDADNVYTFCREHFENAIPTKGRDTIQGIPIKMTTIDRTVDGQVIRDGIKLWHVDTTYFKDKITRMIQAQYERRRFHVFRDIGSDYCKQMTAEHKVIVRDRNKMTSKQIWKPKSTHAANHFWDCEVLAFAAANLLHVSALRREGEVQQHEPETQSPRREGDGWNLGTNNWIGNGGGGWLDR